MLLFKMDQKSSSPVEITTKPGGRTGRPQLVKTSAKPGFEKASYCGGVLMDEENTNSEIRQNLSYLRIGLQARASMIRDRP